MTLNAQYWSPRFSYANCHKETSKINNFLFTDWVQAHVFHFSPLKLQRFMVKTNFDAVFSSWWHFRHVNCKPVHQIWRQKMKLESSCLRETQGIIIVSFSRLIKVCFPSGYSSSFYSNERFMKYFFFFCLNTEDCWYPPPPLPWPPYSSSPPSSFPFVFPTMLPLAFWSQLQGPCRLSFSWKRQ